MNQHLHGPISPEFMFYIRKRSFLNKKCPCNFKSFLNLVFFLPIEIALHKSSIFPITLEPLQIEQN